MIVLRAGKNLQGQRFTRTEQHISITARFALNTDLLKCGKETPTATVKCHLKIRNPNTNTSCKTPVLTQVSLSRYKVLNWCNLNVLFYTLNRARQRVSLCLQS